MNETSINNAIRELEEMTDLLRKISERKITQKQAADKLGRTVFPIISRKEILSQKIFWSNVWKK